MFIAKFRTEWLRGALFLWTHPYLPSFGDLVQTILSNWSCLYKLQFVCIVVVQIHSFFQFMYIERAFYCCEGTSFCSVRWTAIHAFTVIFGIHKPLNVLGINNSSSSTQCRVHHLSIKLGLIWLLIDPFNCQCFGIISDSFQDVYLKISLSCTELLQSCIESTALFWVVF